MLLLLLQRKQVLCKRQEAPTGMHVWGVVV
jgi:hypothetical protein